MLGSSLGSLTMWTCWWITSTTLWMNIRWWLGDSYPTNVAEFAEKHNTPLAGHTIFGELSQFWSGGGDYDGREMRALPRDGSEGSLQAVLWKRMNDFLDAYADRVTHINVVNEMLNGRWMPYVLPCGEDGPCMCDYPPACEGITENLKIETRPYFYLATKTLLAERGLENPLFINEYCTLHRCGREQGTAAGAVKLVKRIQEKSGGSVGGFSAQGHQGLGHRLAGTDIMLQLKSLKKEIQADGSEMKLWISEADIDDADGQNRADAYEQYFRAAFASPDLDGFLMWGFWEGAHWRGGAYLVEEDFTLNAAGRRILGEDGLLNAWKTNEDLTVDVEDENGAEVFLASAFHGTYDVRFGRNCRSAFTVPEGTGEIEVTLRLNCPQPSESLKSP
ncbi:unnamed protein product [Chrysoparadoxa australica]